MSSRGSLLLLVALASFECTPQEDPCFEPGWRVSGTRLLAVRADPPEARFDAAFAAPEVRLRALVAGVDGEIHDFAVSARLCAVSDDPGCPAGLGGQAGGDGIGLFAPPELIASALAADPLRGYGGVRIRADLGVSTGAQRFPGEKQLIYSPAANEQPPNGPLEVSGFVLTRDGVEVAAAGPGGMAELEEPLQYGLRPILGDNAGAETYLTRDLSGRLVQLREHVTWRFYTAGGLPLGEVIPTIAGPEVRFDPFGPPVDEADEPDPGVARPDGLVKLNAFGSGIVWAVARDGRGAVAWAELHVKAVCKLEPPGLCQSHIFGCE